MTTRKADRNLLFGMLALQTGLVRETILVDAFRSWSRDKDQEIGEILTERGAIDRSCYTLLEGFVGGHLTLHDGEARKSLAALSADPSTVELLEHLGDPELTEGLAVVRSSDGTQDDVDPERTQSLNGGTTTSPRDPIPSFGRRFRVLRPHARGGLGLVSVALDTELHREVALKQILGDHADNPDSRRRFLIEGEITGRLEHPGIVPVYGLGTTGDGRPYYAMRLIQGDSLKQAIASYHADQGLKADPGRRSLELRKLLGRFIEVCNAIDYAHSRGILHRDIKPSNIIVGKYGETLVVDWGLAKSMGQSEPLSLDNERVLVPFSSNGSSETLPGSVMGTPSYMSPEQAAGEIDQLGPRSDVYTLGATLYCVLTGNPPIDGTEVIDVLGRVRAGEFARPRQVDPGIDRALEAVCLKAMALNPEDRHSSAKDVAEDVERWLADLPVSAWAEPWGRRARRMARRHRTSATAAAVAVLVALIGLAGVLAVEAQANRDLTAANRLLKAANDRETDANVELREANKREAARFDLAMDAINLFRGEVSSDVLLKDARFDVLRTKLLRGAADFYRKLKDDLKDQADPKSRTALGKAYFELGELTEKIGSKSEALVVHRQALEVRRALADQSLTSPLARADVASSLIAIAALQEATGDNSAALASYQEAQSQAAAASEQVDASNPIRAVLAKSLQGIGRVLFTTGNPDASLESYEKAREIRLKLLKAQPDNTHFQFDLARCHNSIALVLQRLGKVEEALVSHERAREIRQRLAEANPTVVDFQSDLAGSYLNNAIALEKSDRPDEALASYDRSLAIFKQLAQAYPTTTDFQFSVCKTCEYQGYLLLKIGKPGRAMQAFRRGLTISEGLVAANPDAIAYQDGLAGTHMNIGVALAESGQMSRALIAFEKSREIHRRLAETESKVTTYQLDLATSCRNLGELFLVMGRVSEALKASEEALSINGKLASASPRIPHYQYSLALSHSQVATCLFNLGRFEDAGQAYQHAITIFEDLVKAHPATTSYRRYLARSLTGLGWNQLSSGDRAGAGATLRRAIPLFEGLRASEGGDLYELACCRIGLAGRAGPGIPAVDDSPGANRAMDALRDAVAAGYRGATSIQNDKRFDPIRSRPDFKLLTMDLAFPANPMDDDE